MNRFVGGLVTDASPLTTPENTSYDEDNFVLNMDGSRARRFGMDYEVGYSNIPTNITDVESVRAGITSYRWDNPGGDPSASILVVQVGNELRFFHLRDDALSTSGNMFHTEVVGSNNTDIKFSYAVVDSFLVVVNGDKDVYLFEYGGGVVSRSTRRLLIRDFFGVEDTYNGVDIGRGVNIQTRPENYTFAHLYNLRNQSWGIPRIRGNDEEFEDPVTIFHSAANVWPSNTDTVVEALYPDPADTDNRTIDRFFAENLQKNPIGTSHAAVGYFIIDALDRGQSRLSEDAKNRARYPELTLAVEELTADETPGGPSAVAEFAGRVWYAGFPGSIGNGDAYSPRMSSYILFSKVIESVADINMCYQEGDPTSKFNSDIVDTDGGFIRINEAYGIQKMINLGSSLFIIATNGIWRVTGGSDAGFTATAYIVDKISDRGCNSPDTIVQIESSIMFWGEDAIYHVAKDQFDNWICNNISIGRIQRFYDNIPIGVKRGAYGSYDSYDRTVRWLFNNASNNNVETRELVLDLALQAFYTNTINNFSDSHRYPKVVATYVGLPYQVQTNVNQLQTKYTTFHREVGYIVLTSNDGVARFTFSKYHNPDFRDWYTVDGVGVDAPAFIETAFLSGGDFQRMKQAPYLTVYMRRTEDGYMPNMSPMNPSSCIVQSKWGWSDKDFSGKWGREFQAYRYRRNHVPVNSADQHDTGFMLISSKNKLRGRGRVLSLRFSTEPNKNLELYGWGLVLTIKEEV